MFLVSARRVCPGELQYSLLVWILFQMGVSQNGYSSKSAITINYLYNQKNVINQI
jgi:hypothetical protein